jgi:alkanesulfonate monooxygenase SsuD/methylene tetrahydromethanopterin reductase-like flavin-dependent oxidoreductase (luciferase family)
VREGFDESDFVRGGSERLKDALVVMGDEDDVVRRVREHLDAGATHVCLQVLGSSAFDVARDDWRRLAPAVSAL